MFLIKASLKNPYLVATIVFTLTILGVVALANIPIDILPVLRVNAVETLAFYQGMPAESVEKTITNTIERYCAYAIGVDQVESKSTAGVCQIVATFHDGIDPGTAIAQEASQANSSLAHLPPKMLPPVSFPFDPTGTMPLCIVSVTSPDLGEARLKDLTRYDIRARLNKSPGALAQGTFGGKDRNVMVYVDPVKLQARHMSQGDVIEALANGNLLLSTGVAKFGPYEYQLDTNALIRDVKELGNFPLRADPGNAVFVRDVGRAEDSHNIQTSMVRIKGQRTVYQPVNRQVGASSVAVVDEVRKEVPGIVGEIKSAYGADVHLEVVMDQSFSVRESIKGLVHEGLIGAVLVSLMILIFLGNWRMTLIAVLSIPLAVLGSIFGLYLTGNTLNVMTLAGLSLAIGPLVDDAVVELENNHRNYSLGKSRIKAALDGCAEVMIPVMVATSTTIIVLCPIAVMPGLNGQLFRPLALAVAFAMLTSFLLSRTFVPMMCAKFLPDEHRRKKTGKADERPEGEGARPDREDAKEHAAAGSPSPPASGGEGWGEGGRNPASEQDSLRGDLTPPSPLPRSGGEGSHFLRPANNLADSNAGWFRRAHRHVESGLEKLTALYRHFLELALAHRLAVLAGVALLFALSLCQLKFIGQEFFPAADSGQIIIYVRAPSGTNIEATEKRIKLFEAFLHDPGNIEPRDLQLIISEIGIDTDYSAAYTLNSASWDATVRVQLTDERGLSAQEYAIKLRHLLEKDERFADMRFSFNTGGMIQSTLDYGKPSPISVRMRGGSAEQSQAAGRLLRDRIALIPGAADVHVEQRDDAPQRIIEVDRQKAAYVGLSEKNVVEQVASAMNSSQYVSRNIWIDIQSGTQYWISVQYPEDPGMKLENMLNIAATGTNQEHPVILSSLVRIRSNTVPVEINHVEFTRVRNILVNTENRDVGGVTEDILKAIDELRRQGALPEAIHTEVTGEYVSMKSSFAKLGAGLGLASLFVYFLLVGLFRSLKGPFIIMFTVPLGLIGVLTMLNVTGTTLNVQSGLGVIFLVGIAVSNGVLLVDFANTRRKQGLKVQEAIVSAAATRFRPILMTFLATFLDLIPMAIGLGRGSEANIPLGRAVVGGLLTSTCLTLFVVPIMYTLLIRDGEDDSDMDAQIEAEMSST